MLKTVLAAAFAVGLAVAVVPPALATSALKVAEAAPPKQLTPQQQKMKDCAAKWKEERAKTGAKGRTAQRKFMSDCLKKTPA